MGAYLSTFAPAVPTYLYGTLLSGPYDLPAIYVEVKAVFTNTVAVDAYRGAGRPEATYLLERLVDHAARQVGMDRIEIRRKNLIRPDQFPYQTQVALEYDTGDYQATLELALETNQHATYAGAQGRRRRSAASCAAGASRRTSRPAASRRRRWSVRSAPGPACTRRRPCGSTRPGRSRS